MLLNYLKIAGRNLWKNKVFAVVNIAGLSIAMSACLLIGGYIRYEWSYDTQSPSAPYIWRAYNETVSGGRVITQDANTHAILGPSLKADLPDVIDFTRLYNHGEEAVSVVHNNAPYRIADAWMADPGFLRMFPQTFLAGNPTSCLSNPYTLILTATTARNLFADENPVGQQLRVPGGGFAGTYTVTGVVADPPQNTHLKFNLLASYETRHAQGHQDSWDDYWEYTYVQLTPQANPEKIRKQLAIYSAQHLQREGIRLNMQPFLDIHLHSNLTYEIEANNNARTVYFLGLIALFILIIAFINYINLATARSLVRAREVGVRKTIGARRWQLIGQFMTEGGLTSALALATSLMLVEAGLPWFEKLTGQSIVAGTGFDAVFWLAAVALWVVSLLGSCLFPAVVLSGFSPIKALRGQSGDPGTGLLRKGLVVFQFGCSVALLIGLIVIGQQLLFLRNHDKGLVLDQVIALKTPDFNWQQDSLNQQKMGVFVHKIGQLSGVESVAVSSIVPGLGIATISGTSTGLLWPKKPEAASHATVYFYDTERAFFSAYSIHFLAGAPYEAPNRRESRQHIVINEAARRMLGFPDAPSAVGEEIAYLSNPGYRMKIHGVVADFHIESLRQPTRPTLYFCSSELTNGYISLKTSTQQIRTLLTQAEQVWKQTFPESPFEFWFLNEQFKQQYKAESQFSIVFSLFTILAVVVACLGLFGLSTFTAEQRTKEIGVRKVLGASVASIVALLSTDFLKLVLMAILIATPIAWYAMTQWLEDFAYRINLAWWMFVLGGMVSVVIALLTISFQSIKAALMNPVKSLRTE